MGVSGKHHASAALQRLEEKSSASIRDQTLVVQSIDTILTELPWLMYSSQNTKKIQVSED
jgi:hypothetical protein